MKKKIKIIILLNRKEKNTDISNENNYLEALENKEITITKIQMRMKMRKKKKKFFLIIFFLK